MSILVAVAAFIVGLAVGVRVHSAIVVSFVASMPPTDRARWLMLLEARRSALGRRL